MTWKISATFSKIKRSDVIKVSKSCMSIYPQSQLHIIRYGPAKTYSSSVNKDKQTTSKLAPGMVKQKHIDQEKKGIP